MTTAAERAGFAPERLERIADHLNRAYVEPGKIAGCQVAVTRRGHLAYFKSLGQMNRERAKPMRDDTIFRIASMTKPITSVALMTLYERGYFQLNDPVHRFIPSWRDHRVWVSGEGEAMVTERPHRPVSMRDMLCHTGGLTYGTMLEALGAPADRHPVTKEYARIGVNRVDGETSESFIAKLAQVPLRYQPGERWMYSLATDVCGVLVEIISGKRLGQFLHEEIFEPLKRASAPIGPPPCAHLTSRPPGQLALARMPRARKDRRSRFGHCHAPHTPHCHVLRNPCRGPAITRGELHVDRRSELPAAARCDGQR